MEIPFIGFNEYWLWFKPVYYVTPLFTRTGGVKPNRLYVFDNAVVLSSVSMDYFISRDSLEFILYNNRRMQRSKLHDDDLIALYEKKTDKMIKRFESPYLRISSLRNIELEIKENYWRFVVG